MPQAQRGRALSIFAVLFALLAVSNLLKPFKFGGDETGFMLLGSRLSGLANTIVGPLFGFFQLAYAYGIWTMKRFALPMGHAYATYVILNLILFNFRNTVPDTTGYKIFGVVYSAVAIGVSLGAAVLLTRRKAELT
jgi:hypothetical protein